MASTPMIDGLLFALTLATALGCGLMAGVFFAFSTFVMVAPLKAAEPASAEGASLWTRYRASWTAWNHVRTVACLAAAAALTVALCYWPRDAAA